MEDFFTENQDLKKTILYRYVKTLQVARHGQRIYVDTLQIAIIRAIDVVGQLGDINYRLRKKFVEIDDLGINAELQDKLYLGTTLVGDKYFVQQYVNKDYKDSPKGESK